MCFFDQCVYECGDFKWGPFRQHCAKEYRTGETCGMKLVMQNIHVHTKCRICDKLEVKYRRKANEEARIGRWKRQGGKHRKFSIEASENIIEGLNRDIAKLMQERRDRLHRIDGGTETHKREGFAIPVHRQGMERCISRTLTLPTRHRLKDSGIKANLEGSLSSTEALLPQEKTLLPESCTESRLVKGACDKKMALSQPTHKSNDEQSNLIETKKVDREVPLGDILLRPHTGIKFGHQETIIPDASLSRKQSPPHSKSSKTGTESSRNGENDLDTKGWIRVTTAESDIPHDGNHMSEEVIAAHRYQKDKLLDMSSTQDSQETAYQGSKCVNASENLALPTLQPPIKQELRSLPTYQDKGLEILRSFQFSHAERPMLEDLKGEKSPRSGRTKAESEFAPGEPLRPMISVLSPLYHDSMSKQKEMINTIVKLAKQGVFDYLMREFYVFFDQTWSVNLKSCPDSPDSSSGSDETSPNPIVESNTSEGSGGGKKRTRGSPDKDKPEQGDKDDPKRPRLGLEIGTGRLACRYFKRDPCKFGVGTPYCIHGCAGQGWKDLAKLKEHLYRAHHSFFQCPRCKIRLRSQAGLNEHSEADEICESRTRNLEDGFDLETYLHLHNKRKTCKGQTDAERWREIFSRLFPDQPVPSPYVVFETGDVEVSVPSELEDLENFEAYRQREVPKRFANRATIEALKFSEPIARHLLGQVPDMIRDSEEAVSRQYQSLLPGTDPSPSDTCQSFILPSHQDTAFIAQSSSPALNRRMSDRIANHDFPASHLFSHLPKMRQTISTTDPHSSPLEPGFDSGQTRLCFCNGPCTCPSTLPGRFSTNTSSGEDISLILHLVQNMSNRIATLEQHYKGHVSHQDGLLSSSSTNQSSLMQDSSASNMRQNYGGEIDADPDTVPHIQNTSGAFTIASNRLLASTDTSNDSLDWVTLFNMDNPED